MNADGRECCKTRSFIGTTTTGSSLVHCKLYWVPARAALRLGTSDRCCNRQLHSKSWKLSRGRNERTLQRGLLATVSAEKNKNVLTYLLTGFGAPARRVFPDHLITGPVIVRWIALPRRSLRSTVRRRRWTRRPPRASPTRGNRRSPSRRMVVRRWPGRLTSTTCCSSSRGSMPLTFQSWQPTSNVTSATCMRPGACCPSGCAARHRA